MAELDLRTCAECRRRHGKIYPFSRTVSDVHLHNNCRCRIVIMDALPAGTATKSGWSGADFYLKMYGKLPGYYLTREQAKALGWKRKKGNLNETAPGKMLIGGVYSNEDEKLPDKDGRVWYEADIDYESGHRNDSRVLYSNDGLIFVTYDHYATYSEIV